MSPGLVEENEYKTKIAIVANGSSFEPFNARSHTIANFLFN